MKNISGKKNIWIFAACVIGYALYLAVQFYITDGQMGVPLDDTWIHFRYAENFAQGHFFEYNIGEPAAGTTSPLYVVLLAAASFVTSNYVLNSVFISALFHLLSCLLVYKLALFVFSEDCISEQLSSISLDPGNAALLSALLTAVTGRFLWAGLSGMETTLFTFLTLASVYSYLKFSGRPGEIWITSALIGLATATRPEGLLLMLVITLARILNCLKTRHVKKLILNLLISLLVFSIIALPYFIFSYFVSGELFPNTYKGQGGGLRFFPNLNYLRIAVIYFLRDNLVTGVLFASGFVYLIFNFRKLLGGRFGMISLVLVWLYILPIASSFLVPNWRHNMRYTIPLIPFLNVASVLFIAVFCGYARFSRIREMLSAKPGRIALILAFSLLYYSVNAFYIGKNTQNINDQQVKLGYWVRENVGRDETIALNDIGAITFISKNRVIDMAGLINPEVLRYRQYNWDDNLDSLNYLLKKNNVRYIIIYDHWFKEYLDKYERDLTFVTSAVLEHNTICGGVEMKVYKTKSGR